MPPIAHGAPECRGDRRNLRDQVVQSAPLAFYRRFRGYKGEGVSAAEIPINVNQANDNLLAYLRDAVGLVEARGVCQQLRPSVW